MKKGIFIVLEGPDKSGKSTQARLLASHFKKKKIPVVHTREPGGTSFAEAIRRILLSPKHRVDPIAELFLYEAARAQHTRDKLLPAVREGKVVISERYTLATLAYQGFARGLSLSMVGRLNHIASFGLKPDLTLVLDIPETEFGTRDQARALDRLESESAQFRRKVRDGYRTLARTQPKVLILNGRRDKMKLHREIVRRAERLLSR